VRDLQTGLGWLIGFTDTLYILLGTTDNYRATVISTHTLHFTVTHALSSQSSLVVSWQRIYNSHNVTSNHTWSPLCTAKFLFFFCHYSATANSIQFLCSQTHILAGWSLETRLSLLNWNLFYNHFAKTTQKTQSFYCWEGVFTAPLHSKGSYLNVACVFVATGMCLSSRCLAINVYSNFIIPVSGVMSQYINWMCPKPFSTWWERKKF
jgi:hypothetical protein